MPVRKRGSRARYEHIKLKPKGKFDRRSFRTVDVGRKDCTQIIIGCPVGSWDNKAQLCKVGTQAQAVRLELACFGKNLPRELKKYKKT